MISFHQAMKCGIRALRELARRSDFADVPIPELPARTSPEVNGAPGPRAFSTNRACEK
jgi:hypothetical protein